MVKIFLLSVLIIAIAMLLLSVRVLLVKGGTMKSQHIHDNEYMKSKGIHCVIDQDKEERAKADKINKLGLQQLDK